MTYEQQILHILSEVGERGISVSLLAKHVYNLNCTLFSQPDLQEVKQFVQQYLLKNSKSSLFKGLDGEFVYFVHSFYVPVCKETAAVTNYIHPFSAAMQKDNFFATQFHPEKSGEVGQQILRNFLEL